MLEFYGLREHPFGVSPNPRFLYPSVQHREALASLIFGVENQVGFAALIAEPGAGKTTLLFELLLRYRDRASTAFVFNTLCSAQEMLRHIVLELQIRGAEPEHDSVRLYQLFTAYVADRRQTKPVLIIIDEAQNLENSALETLRLLSNFEAADHKLLHIILAGQPQLGEKLRSPSLEQLLQRITTISRLQRFSPAQIEECIAYRLNVAGYSSAAPLFSKAAKVLICEASRGVPREINRICINALQLGFAYRQRAISVEVIEEVLADLNLSGEPRTKPLAVFDVLEAEPAEAKPAADRDKKPLAAPSSVRPAPPAPIAFPASPALVAPVAPVTPRVLVAPPESVAPQPVAPQAPVASPAPVAPPKIAEPRILEVRKREQRKGTGGARIAPLAGALAAALMLFVFTGSVRQPQAVDASNPSEPAQVVSAETQPQETASVAVPANDTPRVEEPEVTPRNSASNVSALRKTSARAEQEVPVRMIRARQLAQSPLNATAPAAASQPAGPGTVSEHGAASREQENATASREPHSVAMNAEPTPAPVFQPEGSKPEQPDATNVPAGVPAARPGVDRGLDRSLDRSQDHSPSSLGQSAEAVLAKYVRPVYPPTAKENRFEGDVSLEVNIATDGNVAGVNVLSGNPLLAQAAKDAVRQWRYRPALLHGTPIEAEEKIIVTFRLGQDRD
jgi:general secretion pathway protein A